MTDSETTSAAEQATGQTIVFRGRATTLVFFMLLGCATMVQASLTALYFIYYSQRSAVGTAMIILFCALFVLAGWWFFMQGWRRMHDPADAITISPAGLHDRALSERPMAWSDIIDLRLQPAGRGGPVIVFDLAEGGAERAGVWPRILRAARLNQRMLGFSYRIHHTGTEADAGSLVWAITPYAEVKPPPPPQKQKISLR